VPRQSGSGALGATITTTTDVIVCVRVGLHWGRGLEEAGVAFARGLVVDGEEVVARERVEAERARGRVAGARQGEGVLLRPRPHPLVPLARLLVERGGRHRRPPQRVAAGGRLRQARHRAQVRAGLRVERRRAPCHLRLLAAERKRADAVHPARRPHSRHEARQIINVVLLLLIHRPAKNPPQPKSVNLHLSNPQPNACTLHG
jgi:hypothetical protein